MEFHELLSRVLREQEGLRGLEVREVREVECTKPGDNFMSDVTVAEVRGQLPAGQPYVGRVFVKRPPRGATVPGFSTDAAFANEVLVYGLIGDVTVCVDCLHASRDVILLQDLAAMGYLMHERPKGLASNVLPSVLQALAKFHGASYVRLQNSEVFREGVAQLRPIGLMLSGNDTMERGLGRMQRLAGEGSEAYEPLGRLLGDAKQRFMALREPGRVAVLAHGDFWLNNIMVNEALEEPVKIVDLQDILSREQYGLLVAAVYLPALFLNCPRDVVLRAGSPEGFMDMDQLGTRVRCLLDVASQRGVLKGI